MGSDFEDIFPNKSSECSNFMDKLCIEVTALRAGYAGEEE